MKFDVIIGNPPYQLSDGAGGGSSSPIYQYFILQSKKLRPKYLSMIVPSRWFSGGKGLDAFRDEMLNDRHLRKLVDYPVSSECFPGVEIKGGVCYFLWNRDSQGDCDISTVRGDVISTMTRSLLENDLETFIRFNEAIPIYRKVKALNESSFMDLVSVRRPFGLSTTTKGREQPNSNNDIILYGNKQKGYIDRSAISVNKEWIDTYKVYITYAYGAGEDFPHQIINKPFLGEKGSACTETYLLLGPCETQIEAENIISYISTKFFRFLILLLKNTQHATRNVYKLVPIQDFSKPWTDEELYAKYNLSDEEIEFIESMIKPMDIEEA